MTPKLGVKRSTSFQRRKSTSSAPNAGQPRATHGRLGGTLARQGMPMEAQKKYFF